MSPRISVSRVSAFSFPAREIPHLRLRLLRSLDLRPCNWLRRFHRPSENRTSLLPAEARSPVKKEKSPAPLLYSVIFVIANLLASQLKLYVRLKFTFVRFRRGRSPTARRGKPGHRSPFDLFSYPVHGIRSI